MIFKDCAKHQGNKHQQDKPIPSEKLMESSKYAAVVVMLWWNYRGRRELPRESREIMSTPCLSLGSPEGGEWTSDFLRKCFWEDLKKECREKKRGSGEDPSKDEISGQDPWRVD